MTTLGFVRHGVTDWNLERRAQGQIDIPLNKEGRRQAAALASRLVGEQWNCIVSSDLSRAKETADIIAQALKLPVLTDRRLREISYGRMEGTTLEERIAKWGEAWDTLDHGIETTEQVRRRSLEFISDMHDQYPDSAVLVVTHGALIGETWLALNLEQPEEPIYNTSLSVVQKEGEKWQCRLYNCVRHLDPAGGMS